MYKNYLMHSALSLCPKSHYGVLDKHSDISINQDKLRATPKLTEEELESIQKVLRYVLDPYELFDMANLIDDKYQMFLINFSSAYMNLLCGTLHDSIPYSQEEELIQCWKSPDIHHKHMFMDFFNSKVKPTDNLKKVKDYYINKVRDFAPNSYRFSPNEPNCHNAAFSLLGDIDIELEDDSEMYRTYVEKIDKNGSGNNIPEEMTYKDILKDIFEKTDTHKCSDPFFPPMSDEELKEKLYGLGRRRGPVSKIKDKKDSINDEDDDKYEIRTYIVDLLGQYIPGKCNIKPKIILYLGSIEDLAKRNGVSRLSALFGVLFHEMFHAIMDRDYIVKDKLYEPYIEEPLAELWSISLLFYLHLQNEVYRTDKFKDIPYDLRDLPNDFWEKALKVCVNVDIRQIVNGESWYYSLGYDLFKNYQTSIDLSIGLYYSGLYIQGMCKDIINGYIYSMEYGLQKENEKLFDLVELIALRLHLKKRELIDSVREYL